MKRREYLAAVGTATGTALAGCLGGSTGTLATQVTTQSGDITDLESCLVTFREFRVMKGAPDEDGTPTEAGQTMESASGTVEGEQAYEVANAEVDLVQLNDADTAAELIDERELETGEYGYLKLLVSNVDATLDGGDAADVRTPGDALLKFDGPFGLQGDTRTLFTAPITVLKNSEQDEYVLQSAN